MERLPPHNIEAEQSVLGAVLIDRDAIIEIAASLRPTDFYRAAHATIYAAMLDLYERRAPIDILTIAEALDRHGALKDVGGRAYLAELSSRTPSAVHIGGYAHIVEANAIFRGLIGAAGRIAEIGYAGTDDKDAIDAAEATLFAVADRRPTNSFRSLDTMLGDAYERITHLHDHRGQLTGIASGFLDLDEMTTGFQRSDLVVVAARPGIGKTSFALNIAEHVGMREKRRVGIFSLEMSEEQLVLRLLAGVSKVDGKKLRTGHMSPDDFAVLTPAMTALARASIYIDDSPNLSAMELRTKARRLSMTEGLDLVIVDYLQLMSATGRNGNRVQEIADISRSLKALARELDIPVIALSQLNRMSEGRATTEPSLSDLRESGAIEQDADLVIFLWRDKGAPEDDIVHLKLAKHRNGPTGEMNLWFRRHLTRFESAAYSED